MSAALSGAPEIHVIRHGETEWSLSGQHTGRTDIPLTAHGEDQARALAPAFAGLEFAHVLASPRQRARRTCELAGLGAAAQTEPALAEWDYGDYEGRRSAEIVKERPGWSVFRDGCPNGETPAQIAARADALLARLAAMSGRVALFTHGQFGVALAARWIGLPVLEAEHLTFGPACRGVLGVAPNHPEVRALSLWNAPPPGVQSK